MLVCITSSKGPESTDIDSEQAHQESASNLNVLRAPAPADINMECTNVMSFDSYNIFRLVNH